MTIESRVKACLSEQLGLDEDEITRDALLVEDLGADSLDLVEMVMTVEEAFSLAIDDDVADTFRTVGDVVDHVTARQSGRAAAS